MHACAYVEIYKSIITRYLALLIRESFIDLLVEISFKLSPPSLLVISSCDRGLADEARKYIRICFLSAYRVLAVSSNNEISVSSFAATCPTI